jgi:hypothetical protein
VKNQPRVPDVNKQITGAQLVLAVMVQKLGGTVTVTADDLLDARDLQLYALAVPDRPFGETIFTVLERGQEATR